MAGYEPDATYKLVILLPFNVTLVVFQELIYVPRLLDCQQKVPAPSKLKGAVMVEETGLHAPTPDVGAMVGVMVRVGVDVLVDVRVTVRVGVNVADPVRVGVIVSVGVTVGVDVSVSVGVRVTVSPLPGF